jgi:hypothetical protein
LSRYFGSSLKEEVAIEWDEKVQCQRLLTQIVDEGRCLLGVGEKLKEQHAEQGEGNEAGAALLRRLIAQVDKNKTA